MIQLSEVFASGELVACSDEEWLKWYKVFQSTYFICSKTADHCICIDLTLFSKDNDWDFFVLMYRWSEGQWRSHKAEEMLEINLPHLRNFILFNLDIFKDEDE